jgi:hypothetical protein
MERRKVDGGKQRSSEAFFYDQNILYLKTEG